MIDFSGIFTRTMVKLYNPGDKLSSVVVVDGFYLVLISVSYFVQFHRITGC